MENIKEINSAIEKIHRPLFKTRNSNLNKWIDLNKDAPNFKLIKQNIFNKTIRYRDEITLVSAMKITPNELKNKGYFLPGNGCLAGSIYTVQAYPDKSFEHVTLHNFGSVAMRHIGYQNLTPYIFNINLKTTNIKPFNYLAMGNLFNEIFKLCKNYDQNNLVYAEEFIENGVDVSKPLLDECIKRYKNNSYVTNYADAIDLLWKVALTASIFRTLSYFYFEATALSLSLCSIDKRSVKLRKIGEINNYPYVILNDKLQRRRVQQRFASYGFNPTPRELLRLLTEMKNEGDIYCSFQKLIISIANNIILYIGSSLNDEYEVRGMLYHDYCAVSQAPDNLLSKLEKSVALYVYEYWVNNKIDLVYNSTFEKGEIGITPNINNDAIKIYHGSYNNDLSSIIVEGSLDLPIKDYSHRK